MRDTTAGPCRAGDARGPLRRTPKRLGPETTGVIIRAFAGQDYLTPPADFEPELGFDEFMGLLRTEEYDPDRIYDVWERMSESPELRALMDANEETGACARGYRERR